MNWLFGAKKADRLTVGIESLQGLLKKSCECTTPQVYYKLKLGPEENKFSFKI